MEFNAIFSVEADSIYQASGRVNLLGEHTDYNNGLVLPMQIDKYTTVSLAVDKRTNTSSTAGTNNNAAAGTKSNTDASTDISMRHNMLSLYSTFDNTITMRHIDDGKQGHWTDYVVGVMQEIKSMLESSIPSLLVHVDSTIPMGAGLSSSAALEIAMLKALRQLYSSKKIPLPQGFTIETSWNDVALAKLGQRAENNYVGLPCGLMDQLVISVGNTKSALLIDFYDADVPKYDLVTLPNSVQFLIISSGIAHTLSETKEGDEGYKTRYEQCQQACKILGVPHLSTLNLAQLQTIIAQNTLPEILLHRVRHVVEENHRVNLAIQAIAQNNIPLLANCMQESHSSYSQLYEASLPEIDQIVDSALEAGAIAARLTGGGFGGSIIAMVKPEEATDVWQKVAAKHPKSSLLM